MPKIGYLIPEFPGQTHIFFWREREALRRRGIDADLVSTRKPPSKIVSHSWSDEAIAETEYLFPVRPLHVRGLARGLVRARGAGLKRVLASIERALGVSAKERLRLCALAAMGGRLADLANERGWQHLHAHSCADAANVALFAHLLSGLPYSLTLHGPLADYGPNQREKWKNAAFAVVITRQLLDAVHAELDGSLPPVIDVAPMGVDTEVFRRQGRAEPWAGSGPLRVFSCGRLNPCKGHVFLLGAVALLRERGLDARLVIAGEDEAGGRTYRRVLEAECERLGLGSVVQLIGAVAEERVRSELESAHLFALASLAEPLGVATMEAMALSLPVVVTGEGGVRELVDHEVDGVLVPPEDPHALALAIERVARDPELSARLGARARSKIETAFHSGRSAELLASRVLKRS